MSEFDVGQLPESERKFQGMVVVVSFFPSSLWQEIPTAQDFDHPKASQLGHILKKSVTSSGQPCEVDLNHPHFGKCPH